MEAVDDRRPFYSDGLHFQCQRCSFCCNGFPGVVLLSEDDLKRLSEWADVTPEQFILLYCRWVEDDSGVKYLSLREKHGNECIFWSDGCGAYEARPVQCSTYPFWTAVLKDETSWKNESCHCPGINKGTLRSREEIDAQFALYKNRTPITKQD